MTKRPNPKCHDCGTPLTDSNRASSKSYCKPCENARVRKWAKDHPDKVRATQLKAKYGIDYSEYEALVERAMGKCSICGKPETNFNQYGPRVLNVDHDHESGRVRGLLCTGCNTKLGWFENNRDAVMNYLRSQP